MSKNVAVFVDVANIFYAAKAAGIDIDYVTLLKSATAGRDFVRAYAYTGLDPENENQRQFHAFLARSGYKVVSKDIRKYGDGRVKANLDIELVVDMMRMAEKLDIAVVVSGDGDFAPAIAAVQQMGVRVEVISFRGNTSSDLIDVADVFIDITNVAKVEKGVRSGRRVASDGDLSMTEVPDKESGVTPRRRRRRDADDKAEKARRRRVTPRRRAAAAGRGAEEVEEPERGAGRRGRRAQLWWRCRARSSRAVPRPPRPRPRPHEAESRPQRRSRAMSSPPKRARPPPSPPPWWPWSWSRWPQRGVRADERAERGQPGEEALAASRAARRGARRCRSTPASARSGTARSACPPTPPRSPPARAASRSDEDFEDEPEVPEYLLAEKKQGRRGGRGGRSGRAAAAAVATAPPSIASATAPAPAPSYSRSSGRSGRVARPARPRASAQSMEPIEQTPGGDPWSEVPPEVQELLKAEMARREATAAPRPRPRPRRSPRSSHAQAHATSEERCRAAKAAAEVRPRRPPRRSPRRPRASARTKKAASREAADRGRRAEAPAEEKPKKTTRKRTTKKAAARPRRPPRRRPRRPPRRSPRRPRASARPRRAKRPRPRRPPRRPSLRPWTVPPSRSVPGGTFLTQGHAAALRGYRARRPQRAARHTRCSWWDLVAWARPRSRSILRPGCCASPTNPAARPCRDCAACRKVAADNHADLHLVAPEGAGEQIRIGQVQQLASELALTAMEGRFRVAVITAAQRLNLDAQNALLKTLEEPGPATCLVLCADDAAPLLPTVLSRSARLAPGAAAHRDAHRAAGRRTAMPSRHRPARWPSPPVDGPGWPSASRASPRPSSRAPASAAPCSSSSPADRRTRLGRAADLISDGAAVDAAMRGEVAPVSASELQPVERRRAVHAHHRGLARPRAATWPWPPRATATAVRDLDQLEELLDLGRPGRPDGSCVASSTASTV